MTGRAEPIKHTAKGIAAKVDAATMNRGGGKAGQADRIGLEKDGHAKLLKLMQIHRGARHPKIHFNESKLINLHVAAGRLLQAPPGIRGSVKNIYPDPDP